MAITATYVSATSFTIGTDLTADFALGARIKADCGTDGIKLGSVTTSSYASGTGLTTVTVALDAGSLTANLTGVLHGNDVPDSMPRATTDYVGASELATVTETVTGTDTARVVTVAAARQAVLSWARDNAGKFPGLVAPALNLFCGDATSDTAPAGTFARSTADLRLGQAGLLESVAADSMRREWGYDGTLSGWRIEDTRTNLLTRSAQFDDTSWTKSRAAVTENAVAAPDGTVTADKIVPDTTSNTHLLRHSVTTVIDTAYVFSVFVKAGGYQYIGLSLYDTTPSVTRFDLYTGTVVSGPGTIVNFGNGWYKCSVPFVATQTTYYGRVWVCATNTLASYAGDGTSGVYAWGAQVEEGLYATSYISTTTAAVARSADVWTLTLATSWFNAAAGTAFAAGRTPAGAPASGAVQVLAQYDDGSANNRIRIARDENRVLRCIVTTAGTEVANLSLGTLADVTTFRVAFAWSTSEFAASLSGGTAVTATAATLPTGLTTHRIGADSAGASQWGGHVLHDAYFPVALTAAQLQAITL